MRRLVLLLLPVTGGCQREATKNTNLTIIDGPELPPPPGTPVPPPAPSPPPPPASPAFPPAPGTPGGLPDDRRPLAEQAPDSDGARAAYAVVEAYYAELEAHDAATALGQWRDPGTGRQAVAAAIAAPVYHANIGRAGRVEAGAGQRHVSFPVQPYGVAATGRNFATLDTITLQRTVVDGATADQRAWRIVAIDPVQPRSTR